MNNATKWFIFIYCTSWLREGDRVRVWMSNIFYQDIFYLTIIIAAWSSCLIIIVSGSFQGLYLLTDFLFLKMSLRVKLFWILSWTLWMSCCGKRILWCCFEERWCFCFSREWIWPGSNFAFYDTYGGGVGLSSQLRPLLICHAHMRLGAQPETWAGVYTQTLRSFFSSSLHHGAPANSPVTWAV